jgi:hypothetical protein
VKRIQSHISRESIFSTTHKTPVYHGARRILRWTKVTGWSVFLRASMNEAILPPTSALVGTESSFSSGKSSMGDSPSPNVRNERAPCGSRLPRGVSSRC